MEKIINSLKIKVKKWTSLTLLQIGLTLNGFGAIFLVISSGWSGDNNIGGYPILVLALPFLWRIGLIMITFGFIFMLFDTVKDNK